jgi:hypothetical protein
MENNKITTKVCFKCSLEKQLTDFYKHKKTSDGHLGKCKTCTKFDSNKREKELRKNPEWIEKEKERAREKYHRLGYKDKHRPIKEQKIESTRRHKEKYPYKKKATNASQRIKKLNKSNHNHHWSYREEHWKDVIELDVKTHNLIHRLMDYDPKSRMYISVFTGNLLDTKDKHLEHIEYCVKCYN